MAIRYEPSKLLSRYFSENKLKKFLTKKVTLKKTALTFVNNLPFVNKKSVEKVALKTIKDYKRRIKDNPDIEDEILKNPRQLVHRVQNSVVTQVAGEIRTQYNGEFYVWLPSDADEPDPEHQLKYGKKFRVGAGEMPGERYGCRCGMQILTDDKTLSI